MRFEEFPLHPEILKAVADEGYSEPTPIQEQAIPKALEGSDIKASAQTGTGKTAAFLLPILHRLASSRPKEARGPRALVLAPTRELAMQIAVQANTYSKYLPRLRTVFIGGGIPYGMQLRDLSRPYDLLIATPGRLIDFIGRRKINLSAVEVLVLDEADRMLDMGFIDPVKEIASLTPPSRQTLLFSATLRGNVLKLSECLLNKPLEIAIQPQAAQQNNIRQTLHIADDLAHKNKLLDHILNSGAIGSAIVFTATKRHADELADELQDKGHLVAALHGDMSQRERTRTVAHLRDGKIAILVATDVAARGIDVPSITHVINFDLPRSAEDYVHRIGRTGRAGMKGESISFATRREGMLVKQIEKYTQKQIDIVEIAGLEPRSAAPAKKKYPAPRNRPPFRRFKGR